jgi:transposase
MEVQNQLSDRYKYENLKNVVEQAISYVDIARRLNINISGSSLATIKKYIAEYKIDTSHFTHKGKIKTSKFDLTDILVEKSQYSRACLKRRLLETGLKKEECEICGQKNEWNGKHLIMILDHVNGINNDNRLENLRMVCPNCNYQLDTTSGRNNKKPRKICPCGKENPSPKHIYCSISCRVRSPKYKEPRPDRRKVERPSYEELCNDLETMSVLAVGRKYGVSDNSIRKWIKYYEKF